MGRVTIAFPSATELGTQYSAAPVPTSETDAIVVKSLSVDPNAVTEVGGNTQATLFIKFTKGSLTNVDIKIYGSYVANPASTDWFQETVETDSAGVATLDNHIIRLTDNKTIAYHIPMGAYKALKITVLGNGTASGSSITLNLGLRIN